MATAAHGSLLIVTIRVSKRIICACLFCLLSPALGAGAGPRRCDDDLKAVSDFKHLTDDTVNALPRFRYSKRLQRLLDRAESASKVPIRFTQLPANFPNTSATEATRQERVIALRVGMGAALEENAIAHELFHIILQGRGFAAMVHVSEAKVQGDARWLPELGYTITSCVDDALIDRRMANLGFDPKVLNHDAAENLKRQPPVAPNDPIAFNGTALLVVCYSHRLRAPSDQIQQTWAQISPAVAQRSEVLAKQIGDIGCNDARTCLDRKKRVRDALGYPITFCNPATGEDE
ncbi:MAG: hypothetical protein ABR921_16920 [Candidatus Sulfotelmatobacter sp.]|jgi:hypothetical protein